MAAHIKSKHPPVPARNTVAMEESDDALLDAAIADGKSTTVPQAAPVPKAQTLRERFPIEKFIEEEKAKQARFQRKFHKDTYGTEECGERCARTKPENRLDCPEFSPWSIHIYGGKKEFDALYEYWLREKAKHPGRPVSLAQEMLRLGA